MCNWIEEGRMDRNLDEGVEMVEMKGFALSEEWMACSIIVNETVKSMK